MDDSVRMTDMRGEKRVAEPSTLILQQPANKQIRLATDMAGRQLMSNIRTQTNGRPIVMNNGYVLQGLPKPSKQILNVFKLFKSTP